LGAEKLSLASAIREVRSRWKLGLGTDWSMDLAALIPLVNGFSSPHPFCPVHIGIRLLK